MGRPPVGVALAGRGILLLRPDSLGEGVRAEQITRFVLV